MCIVFLKHLLAEGWEPDQRDPRQLRRSSGGGEKTCTAQEIQRHPLRLWNKVALTVNIGKNKPKQDQQQQKFHTVGTMGAKMTTRKILRQRYLHLYTQESYFCIYFFLHQGQGYISHDDFLLSMTTRGGEVARNRDRQYAAGGATDHFDWWRWWWRWWWWWGELSGSVWANIS